MTDQEKIKELQSALSAALEWIDAIPAELADQLPTMPGFDRDWAESLADSRFRDEGVSCQPD